MEVSDCFDFCTSTPCGCFPFKLLNIGAGFGDENLISRGGAMRAFAGTCVLSVTHARICPITRLKSVFASSPSLRSCPDGPFFIMQASFTIDKVCVRERDCKISKLKCSLIWIKKKTAKNTVNTCVICNIHVEISRLFVIAKVEFPREISSTS